MRTIYLDSDFKCHVSDDGTMTAVQIDFFEGKCNTFIEGYIYVPKDENWKRFDGVVFQGEMIAPWKPYSELLSAQEEYENIQLELTSSYQEGVNSV